MHQRNEIDGLRNMAQRFKEERDLLFGIIKQYKKQTVMLNCQICGENPIDGCKDDCLLVRLEKEINGKSGSGS